MNGYLLGWGGVYHLADPDRLVAARAGWSLCGLQLGGVHERRFNGRCCKTCRRISRARRRRV